jgi:restriction endonuclease
VKKRQEIGRGLRLAANSVKVGKFMIKISNIIDYIQNKLNAKLTRKTILEIVKMFRQNGRYFEKPADVLDLAINKINSIMNKNLWQMTLNAKKQRSANIKILILLKTREPQ